MSRGKRTSGLSRDALEALLLHFHPDREQAAERYNRLRDKLIHFFTWERCSDAAGLSDEVLDRTARRISEGEQIANIDAYAAAVARLVALEARKAVARAQQQLRIMPSQARGEDDEAIACLERCLDQLAAETRAFILEYYSGEGEARIATRRRMAESFGIPLNTLRNRALRLRSALQTCLQECLGSARDEHGHLDTSGQEVSPGSEPLS